MQYRVEIDGLRAIAVISVIIFHLGLLPNGFLGVDVFFVISGFLITNIIYKEILKDNFSILNFYKRRIRRIIPLLLFISLISLLLGVIFMLPDDIIGLSKSIIASNFFSNNFLLFFTSTNYWESPMDYKPLMHTWSLGIEEQFYLFYPLIFIFFKNKKSLLVLLSVITLLSLFLFFFSDDSNAKFYLLPFRFFELSIGGLFALAFYGKKEVSKKLTPFYYMSLITLILLLLLPYKKNSEALLLCIISSAFIITLSDFFSNSAISKILLGNKYFIYIGKISFSLYMWHQVVFSFARYVFLFEISAFWSVILFIITFLLSILTYNLIEKPLRNQSFSFVKVMYIVLGLFVINIVGALYLLSVEGVYKDFIVLNQHKNNFKPEISKVYDKKKLTGALQDYNEKINQYNISFPNTNNLKILIIGDSFGRDLANIILESNISDSVSISYINIRDLKKENNYAERLKAADYVFLSSSFSRIDFEKFLKDYNCTIEIKKVYYFGTKNFGYSMGLPYNNVQFKNNVDFKNYYTPIRKEYVQQDKKERKEWGNQYISLLTPIISEDEKSIKCFDSNGKFLSHDSAHLTKYGAQFYAQFYDSFLKSLIKKSLIEKNH